MPSPLRSSLTNADFLAWILSEQQLLLIPVRVSEPFWVSAVTPEKPSRCLCGRRGATMTSQELPSDSFAGPEMWCRIHCLWDAWWSYRLPPAPLPPAALSVACVRSSLPETLRQRECRCFYEALLILQDRVKHCMWMSDVVWETAQLIDIKQNMKLCLLHSPQCHRRCIF